MKKEPGGGCNIHVNYALQIDSYKYFLLKYRVIQKNYFFDFTIFLTCLCFSADH